MSLRLVPFALAVGKSRLLDRWECGELISISPPSGRMTSRQVWSDCRRRDIRSRLLVSKSDWVIVFVSAIVMSTFCKSYFARFVSDGSTFKHFYLGKNLPRRRILYCRSYTNYDKLSLILSECDHFFHEKFVKSVTKKVKWSLDIGIILGSHFKIFQVHVRGEFLCIFRWNDAPLLQIHFVTNENAWREIWQCTNMKLEFELEDFRVMEVYAPLPFSILTWNVNTASFGPNSVSPILGVFEWCLIGDVKDDSNAWWVVPMLQ